MNLGKCPGEYRISYPAIIQDNRWLGAFTILCKASVKPVVIQDPKSLLGHMINNLARIEYYIRFVVRDLIKDLHNKQ